MQIEIFKDDYLPAGKYSLNNLSKSVRAMESLTVGSSDRDFLIAYDKIGGLIVDVDSGVKLPVHTFWNIEKIKMSSMQNLSDDELETIIRLGENSNIPGSRYQRASNEWNMRHQKKMLEATKANSTQSAFVKIGAGAIVKGLKMHNNTMTGKGDFLKNEGELSDADLEGNKHIVQEGAPMNPEGKINWTKWGTIATVIGIAVAILLALTV
jgi:hypothetical protein